MDSFELPSTLQLDRALFATTLQELRKGLSPGLGGTRYEYLKLCLEDPLALQVLTDIIEIIANGHLPPAISHAMRLSGLTALRKNNGRVRGIAAGDTYRRLASKILAKMKQSVFRNRVEPSNFGLSAHSGTDQLGHLVRIFTEASPNHSVLAIDGVGAFDHIRRSKIFDELLNDPEVSSLIPFARMWYQDVSTLVWADDEGNLHEIFQADGGEQGDALMPSFFSLALKPALQKIQSRLHADDLLSLIHI